MGWLERSRPGDLIADCLSEFDQIHSEESAVAARDPFMDQLMSEMNISIQGDGLMAAPGWCTPSFPGETI